MAAPVCVKTYTVALGARPTYELGLFAYANAFDADITLGSDGSVQRAQLSSSALRVDLAQKDKTWRATIDARGWQAPGVSGQSQGLITAF